MTRNGKIRLSYRTVTCPKCGARVSFWTLAAQPIAELEAYVGDAHHVVERASHKPIQHTVEVDRDR